MTGVAARLSDPLEHSSALGGLLAGLAIGAAAVLVGIAVIGTGGLGALALTAMVGAGAATGAGIGQLLGSLSFACRQTGRILSGSHNVYINGKPAARASLDYSECSDHPGIPKTHAEGSDSVYINGQPAVRVGDRTVCDAKVSSGSPNVFIGGGTQITEVIDPEVPAYLERAVIALGLASALVLASPVVVVAGLISGIAGGSAGHWAGGKLFGDGGDGQKLMAFSGALAGGTIGVKGGRLFDSRYEFRLQGLSSNLGGLKIITKHQDLIYLGNVRGTVVELPGIKLEKLTYVKRPSSDLIMLRRKFDSVERKAYLKSLCDTPEKILTLKKYGFSDAEISNMLSGKRPTRDWQVHHIKPLDDGGTNAFENLTVILNDPYHVALTNAQNSMTRSMKPGESRVFEWPMIDVDIYPPLGF